MRALILIAALLIGFHPALADDRLGNIIDLSRKGLGGEPAYDGREGGETIEDAFPIPELPFDDTGATCDNVHDYDETCPYDANLAPDVVYVFTPTEEGGLDIDLCESLYDTKVYVYDFEAGYGFGNPLACNDDAGCGYTGYQSELVNVPVETGHSYYIVIDGYGDSCGQYILAIDWYVPCTLECPPDAEVEGEPPIVDGYIDNYNSGCAHVPDPLFQLLCGNEDFELTMCCNAGNYSYQGASYRDTDWFTLYKAADPLSVTAIAEYPTYVFQVGFDPVERCNGSVTFDHYILLEPCAQGTLPLVAEIGGEVWVVAACAGWEDYPEFLYIMSFEGIEGTHTAVVETTWGAVKEMFR